MSDIDQICDNILEYGEAREAIAALARHPELPIPFSLAMMIPGMQDGVVVSVVDAVEETGLITDRAKAEQRVREGIKERSRPRMVEVRYDEYRRLKGIEEAASAAREALDLSLLGREREAVEVLSEALRQNREQGAAD